MDAPTYPPPIAFEQPAAVPYAFLLENVSLADLMEMPAAWTIVTKHLPALKWIVTIPIFVPQLDNFSVPTMQPFMPTTPEVIAAIDVELRQLPWSDEAKP